MREGREGEDASLQGKKLKYMGKMEEVA